MTWLKLFWMQGWGYFVQMLSYKAEVPFAMSRSPIHLPIMFCLRSDSRAAIVNSETWRRLSAVARLQSDFRSRPQRSHQIILVKPKARRLIRYLVKVRCSRQGAY